MQKADLKMSQPEFVQALEPDEDKPVNSVNDGLWFQGRLGTST